MNSVIGWVSALFAPNEQEAGKPAPQGASANSAVRVIPNGNVGNNNIAAIQGSGGINDVLSARYDESVAANAPLPDLMSPKRQ